MPISMGRPRMLPYLNQPPTKPGLCPGFLNYQFLFSRVRTMRKITKQIGDAYHAGSARRIDNTETDGQSVWLHGNRIIYRDSIGRSWFTLAGWPTPTTRERLQIVVRVHQSKHLQYWNNTELDSDRWYRVENDRLESSHSVSDIEQNILDASNQFGV